jgi:hypothetical protein
VGIVTLKEINSLISFKAMNRFPGYLLRLSVNGSSEAKIGFDNSFNGLLLTLYLFIGLTEVVLSSAYSHTHIYVHTSGFNYCTERSEQIC